MTDLPRRHQRARGPAGVRHGRLPRRRGSIAALKLLAAVVVVAFVSVGSVAAYAVWDVALSRSKGWFRPYVRALNLTDTRYQEVPGVPVQGRTVMAGAEMSWSKGR